ncbi:Riboflavin biosynthesis protein ribF [Listeria grayi]|uniref:Riboflavin biosynthesis protein n=1 Tax=Listeria grayi FSL F6-1183 TaxID=1265827 RepID=A0A829RBB4_LISGR|nr:bifunctional riboflavin kinase/FAD synthetase [Listeria grayi]EUJ30079.1 putative riboflavin kinase and FAD synthase [Listeria grayi FSL F6-1183]VEI33844.1 Riboflavin biosynthesis protein ribF [Listeria grayi]
METIYLHEPNTIQVEQEPKVIALGFFDGVHLGHQAVIRSAKSIADASGIKTAVLTFDPHPSVVLSKKRNKAKYLTPIEEKARKVEAMGVDYFYVVRFTTKFSELEPKDFVQKYLLPLGAVHIVAGFDYTYGRLGAGKMADMEAYAENKLQVTIVDKQEADNQKISSTAIRQAIEEGSMEEANKLLGEPYTTKGTVIHGDKRGRTIGFPTANILVEEDYLIPKLGVYAVKFKIGNETHLGMASIGYNITFKDDQSLSIEVYILDFNREIYGEEVEIEWFQYFRPELKFSGMEGLIKQLEKDEQDTREYFQKNK